MSLVKKITKIGNSYGLILPSEIMALVDINPDDEVEISVAQGGLLIHPTKQEDQEVIKAFNDFINRYDETLSKLAQ
jgi:putative addiction module antidote